MKIHYTFKPQGKFANAVGKDLNVSFKHAVAICDKLRGMMLGDAIELLEGVIRLEKVIPFRRFRTGIGHRRGLSGAEKIGKYPRKASEYILRVLRNAEANAEYKGLDTENLKIVHIQALRGVSRRRRKPKGRWKNWRTRFTHVQVIVKEIARKETEEDKTKKKKETVKKEKTTAGKKPKTERKK